MFDGAHTVEFTPITAGNADGKYAAVAVITFTPTLVQVACCPCGIVTLTPVLLLYPS
jgi:hypothetical protein